MLSYIFTKDQLTVFIDAEPYSFNRADDNFEQVKLALKKGDTKQIVALSNVAKSIENYSEGTVSIKNGAVYYKGKETHHVIAERILTLMKENLPFKHLMLVMENLFKNPSYRAVQELYPFLENKNLPITDDGCFLGYKRVRTDFTDKHSGKIANKIGVENRIERNTVDDDWRVACSNGLHVGDLTYVTSFGSDPEPILIVKVNPADVISVPANECTKLRTCAYIPIGIYKEPLSKPIYNSNTVEPIEDSEYDDYEEDDNDDYEDDDFLDEDFDIDSEDTEPLSY